MPQCISSNIYRLSNFFTVGIRKKFVVTILLKVLQHLKCVAILPSEIYCVSKATIENKTMSVTAHCKKLTIKATCLLSQLLFIVIKHLTVFTLNVQCVCLAAGRCTQAGDATDQWRNQPNAAAVYSTQ